MWELSNLSVLRFCNVDKCAASWMDDVKKLHDGSAIVGDGGIPILVHNELVHPAGAKGGPNSIHNRLASIDIAHKLCTAL